MIHLFWIHVIQKDSQYLLKQVNFSGNFEISLMNNESLTLPPKFTIKISRLYIDPIAVIKLVLPVPGGPYNR